MADRLLGLLMVATILVGGCRAQPLENSQQAADERARVAREQRERAQDREARARRLLETNLALQYQFFYRDPYTGACYVFRVHQNRDPPYFFTYIPCELAPSHQLRPLPSMPPSVLPR